MTKARRVVSLTAGVVALAVASFVAPANAIEHVELGLWYNLHTNPVGTCPGIDWHVVVDADKNIAGYLSWDRMKHSAKLSGTLNADDTFHVVATEVDGNRRADISGKATSGGASFTINGTGTGCDKQTFQVAPPVNYAGGGAG